jgi:hypothetical protein
MQRDHPRPDAITPLRLVPGVVRRTASLMANAEQAQIYADAKERGFQILASWQVGKMYVRFMRLNGQEWRIETTNVAGLSGAKS